MKGRTKRIHKNILLAAFMVCNLILLAGCGGSGTKTTGDGNKTSKAEALQEVNVIPEDGIITKEQFETVAGQDKVIQFTGETEDGISYVWTYDASKIQNPDEQNLKVDFALDGLDDIKKQANNANDALKMTMYGKGLIAVPTLEVTLPSAWKSDAGLLLKEQGGKLAKMSDVTIDSKAKEADTGENEADKDSTNAPAEGTTLLSMTVTSLDGDCYIVGGITGKQNKGAQTANAGNNTSENAGDQNTDSGNDAQEEAPGSDETGNQESADNGDTDVKNDDVANDAAAPTCTISISCETILNNMDKLTDGKEEFVPSDGLILAPSTVEFEEGESVFDVLQRVCKDAGIHMESSNTPAYNSAYVEGINQIYEFDCGELSGWMYSVNGWFPNYGCSKYTVSDGDVITWVYTCDLGKDVGDNSMH